MFSHKIIGYLNNFWGPKTYNHCVMYVFNMEKQGSMCKDSGLDKSVLFPKNIQHVTTYSYYCICEYGFVHGTFMFCGVK